MVNHYFALFKGYGSVVIVTPSKALEYRFDENVGDPNDRLVLHQLGNPLGDNSTTPDRILACASRRTVLFAVLEGKAL